MIFAGIRGKEWFIQMKIRNFWVDYPKDMCFADLVVSDLIRNRDVPKENIHVYYNDVELEY